MQPSLDGDAYGRLPANRCAEYRDYPLVRHVQIQREACQRDQLDFDVPNVTPLHQTFACDEKIRPKGLIIKALNVPNLNSSTP